MTVRELIAALQALPPEAQDYKVHRYCDWEVGEVEVDWAVAPNQSREFFVALI